MSSPGTKRAQRVSKWSADPPVIPPPPPAHGNFEFGAFSEKNYPFRRTMEVQSSTIFVLIDSRMHIASFMISMESRTKAYLRFLTDMVVRQPQNGPHPTYLPYTKKGPSHVTSL